MQNFKPMLAKNVDLDKLQFPVAVQKKYDGERLIYKEGKFLSRSMKPITNLWLVEKMTEILKDCSIPLDGEIQVNRNFADTSGFVRKSDRQADFIYHVFDTPIEGLTFKERHKRLTQELKDIDSSCVKLVPYLWVADMEALMDLHDVNASDPALDGTITRNLESPYKTGRSTIKVGHVMKIKDFDDDEAEIIGFTERMHNKNDAQTNELGRTFRSSAKEGLEPTGMLATYVVKWRDTTFDVTATGTLESRKERWESRDSLLGRLVKFQYMGIGKKGRPRHPVELGIRDEEDLS